METRGRRDGGRPRTFDEDRAVDAAIAVFLRSGYEGTSLTELTSAMGINRPSLYNAFGSKEELFCRALERYRLTTTREVEEVLAQPTVRDVLRCFLRASVMAVTGAGPVPGSLLIQGGLTCAPNNARIPQILADYRRDMQDALERAIGNATDAARLPAGFSPAALAGYAATVAHGISVQAATGTATEALTVIVDISLESLGRLLEPQHDPRESTYWVASSCQQAFGAG